MLLLFVHAAPGPPAARAAGIPYTMNAFGLINNNADGFAISPDGGLSVILTGGNNGSGLTGTTDLVTTANASGIIAFSYMYSSVDMPGFDWAGYLIGNLFTQLADTDGQAGTASFTVSAGDIFGFRVETFDNTQEPGVFTIDGFSVAADAAPEPATLPLAAAAVAICIWRRRRLAGSKEEQEVRARGGSTRHHRTLCRRHRGAENQKRLILPVLILLLSTGWFAHAQGQSVYSGVNVSGQLALKRTVNLSQQALTGAASFAQRHLAAAYSSPAVSPQQDRGKVIPLLRPPLLSTPSPRADSAMSADQKRLLKARIGEMAQSMSINPVTQAFGFDGLTHAQQRLANSGNQFSVEPPSPAIAVGNGYILQGVNNAVQVYTTAGVALLSHVLSSNQVFGLPPAIDQNTGINGVFPTDMRVFFDSGATRWFILQRTQDNDVNGFLLPSSRIYLAVSQTNDPTGNYNIYEMDTTDDQNFLGCPCFSDYLQIGADQYGFYITADEYNTFFPYFIDATILAISKTALAAGAAAPTAVQFTLPFNTGYEFAIQPASTPPGASYFLASGGVEYFVSSQARFAIDSSLAIWAMVNTSTLLTANPALQLLRINIPTQTYSFPDVANQRPGPLPYGSSLTPPGVLEFLDGNDDRVLSLCYSGGRLYLTLATAVVDAFGRIRIGVAYFILSPSLRNGALAAPVLRQGTVVVDNNHLLRPAIAVNPQGNGAIVFTLVGNDYYPSAAFIPIGVTSTASTIQIAASGAGPEDGFSGYTDPGQPGIARWGDYSGAVVASDGSIWMTTEYIPNAFRTQKANWGTYVLRFVP
jgi:hypothetical protein